MDRLVKLEQLCYVFHDIELIPSVCIELYRPVRRLYPLEMASERDSKNSAIDNSSQTNKVENNDKELGDGDPAIDEEPSCTSLLPCTSQTSSGHCSV